MKEESKTQTKGKVRRGQKAKFGLKSNFDQQHKAHVGVTLRGAHFHVYRNSLVSKSVVNLCTMGRSKKTGKPSKDSSSKRMQSISKSVKKQGREGKFHGKALATLEKHLPLYMAAGKTKTEFWKMFFKLWYDLFPPEATPADDASNDPTVPIVELPPPLPITEGSNAPGTSNSLGNPPQTSASEEQWAQSASIDDKAKLGTGDLYARQVDKDVCRLSS